MAWIPGCKMPGGESRAHFRRVMRRRVGLATPPQGGKAGKNTSWCLRPAASGKTACLEHCQPEREGGSPPAPPGVSSWLEPCAGKLARTVLRGGAASNGRSLPDPTTSPPPPELRTRPSARLAVAMRFANAGGLRASVFNSQCNGQEIPMELEQTIRDWGAPEWATPAVAAWIRSGGTIDRDLWIALRAAARAASQ